MRAVVILMIAACEMAFSSSKEGSDILGTWQVVRAQYGDGEMTEMKDFTVYKTFTATRWSAVWYNKDKKMFDGAGGGRYQYNGSQYLETLEFYSWESEAVGKTFTFTLTIENGMLHQKGLIEYKGNPKYVIEEWYKRID